MAKKIGLGRKPRAAEPEAAPAEAPADATKAAPRRRTKKADA